MRFSSLMLVGCFLDLAVVVSAAQSRGPLLRRYPHPLETVTLDLATGTVSYGPAVRSKATATVSDFPNLDITGFSGIDTGNCFCEWFDAGIKGLNGNASDLMDNIVLAYCTAKLDPRLGGPGGKTKLGFYEGYVHGGGTPTTAVAVFTLSGLPGNSTDSSYYGDYKCFFLQVRLPQLVCFADGPIGYSWKFLDVGSDGVLAGTWPMLACVQSCSGSGPDALGQSGGRCGYANTDQYCPPGVLRPCFSIPTVPFPVMSMSMDIREAADVSSTAIPFNGDGINADLLAASAAVVGQDWTAQVTLGHAHGSSGLVAIRVRRTPMNGLEFPSPFGGRLTEILITGTQLASLVSTHDGAASAAITVPLPKLAGLISAPWAAQAAVVGGGHADLSSSVFGAVGTE